MAVLVIGLVVAIVLLLLARFLPAYLKIRRFELAITGPPSLPFVGNILQFLGLTEENFVPRLIKLWGWRTDLYRVNLFGTLAVLVSDPDHLEQIFKRKDLSDKALLAYQFIEDFSRSGLVTLNGAAWRAHRRAIQPAFHPAVLDRYTDIFSEEAEAFVERLTPGVEQDVVDNLRWMTARAFIRTALVSEVEGKTELALPDFVAFLGCAARSVSERTLKPWLWSRPVFGLTALAGAMRGLKDKIDALCSNIIADRRTHLQETRAANERKGCEEDFIKQRPTLLDILLSPTETLSLSDGEIMDEFKIFLAAAVETTVSALGSIIKTLSIRPDVQERLLEEVQDVLGQNGVTSSKDIDKLEYTERVVKETMRLLPAVPVTLRLVKEETEFCGRTLPAGTSLIVNILGAHRDPRHWPEPLRFDPDRFLAERSESRHPHAYIPFSAGPRNCIGARYSMMVMKTLLATIVPRYRIDPVPGSPSEPADFLEHMTVDVASRMLGGVHVRLTPRTSCA